MFEVASPPLTGWARGDLSPGASPLSRLQAMQGRA